jgi:hypothetical protein
MQTRTATLSAPIGRTGTRSRAAAIDAVIAIAAILPLLITAHLPLTDLPNHLARQYILRDWANSPILQTFYSVHWALVPNLALELFVLVARQVMSIDLAVRAFCIATILMLCYGTKLINQRLAGPDSRIYRIAPLLCYGGPLQYGFLSYCFGIGLALILFGAWLTLRARPAIVRIPCLAAAGFALLLCHLAAYGLFAIAVEAAAIADTLAIRNTLATINTLAALKSPAAFKSIGIGRLTRHLGRLAEPFAALVPPFLLFVWLSPTAGAATDNAIRFSSLHDKLRGLDAITFFTRPFPETLLLALALFGFAAALITRTIRINPTGLLIVAIMLVVWLLMPGIAMGAAYIDYRIPWAVAFFLLAAITPGPAATRFAIPFTALFTLLTAGRIALIAALWLAWEPTIAAIDTALAQLPAGTRMTVVDGTPAPGALLRNPDLANVASYLVVHHPAFEPTMFASLSGQILYFQPHYLDLWRQGGFGHATPNSLESLPPDYDHVLVLHPSRAHIAADLPLRCQASGPDFALLRVVATAPSRPLPCLGTP